MDPPKRAYLCAIVLTPADRVAPAATDDAAAMRFGKMGRQHENIAIGAIGEQFHAAGDRDRLIVVE